MGSLLQTVTEIEVSHMFSELVFLESTFLFSLVIFSKTETAFAFLLS